MDCCATLAPASATYVYRASGSVASALRGPYEMGTCELTIVPVLMSTSEHSQHPNPESSLLRARPPRTLQAVQGPSVSLRCGQNNMCRTPYAARGDWTTIQNAGGVRGFGLSGRTASITVRTWRTHLPEIGQCVTVPPSGRIHWRARALPRGGWNHAPVDARRLGVLQKARL